MKIFNYFLKSWSYHLQERLHLKIQLSENNPKFQMRVMKKKVWSFQNEFPIDTDADLKGLN